MKINEFDDISINGQFDLLFRDTCKQPCIDWRLLKSLAFNESELLSVVEGGLFRTPARLYYDYDGVDPKDPQDSIKTIYNILLSWYEELCFLPEEERIKYIILAYKLRFTDIKQLISISTNFDTLIDYFSPHLIMDVKRIISFAEELEK